jgi:hypothetical protein
MSFKSTNLRFTFYVLLLTLLVACNPTTDQPTITRDTTPATNTPTLSDPIATNTPIPPPTTPTAETAYPDVTNNDSYPAPEATVAIQDGNEAYPAPETESETDSPEGDDHIAHVSVSPNGEWQVFLRSEVVEIETSDEDGWQDTLYVQHISGEPSYTLKEQTRNFGLGYTLPDVINWTADSSRIYFGDRNIVDGGGLFAGFKTVSYFEFQTFFVIDLYTDDAYNLTLASDYSTLATVSWGLDPQITIHQLDTNTAQTIPLPVTAEYAGDIHWSNDLSYLVVTTSNDTFSENPVRAFIRVNIADGTTQTLWENVPNEPFITDWIGEGNLPIRDRNGNEWRLNPDTSELITVE